MSSSVRILVTGSRHLPPQATRLVALGLDLAAEQYGCDAETATLVHGDAPGADQLADNEAQRRGWQREPHPARWNQLGRAAGPMRNNMMIDAGANVCVVYPGGTGTAHCAAAAAQAGIPLLRIDAADARDRNGLIMVTSDGWLRCVASFGGEQCVNRSPHRRHRTGRHRSASGLQWTMSGDGNTPVEYLECPATWDDGRQCRGRAGHDGLHRVGRNGSSAVRWNDTRSHIARGPLPPPNPDHGHRTEGEYQAMRLYGIEW